LVGTQPPETIEEAAYRRSELAMSLPRKIEVVKNGQRFDVHLKENNKGFLMDAEKIARQIAAEIRPFNVRWMKLRFAATYVGINKDWLKRLAEQGDVVGYPDPDNGRGDWIFDRESLDAYRLYQQRDFQNKLLELEREL